MGISDSTLTSKGQTTIPAEIRQKLKLKTGDKIRYFVDGDKVYFKVKNKKLSDLAGMLHRPGQAALSSEESDKAVGDYLAEDDKRIVDDWNRHKHSS
ncbi:AbrB/MazE/SpoVT family DNA-binding domain-containing protein [Rhizobium sp. NRK18]|uniref:AbrB/MazE/SpoVT family DNA-binding domain-containing protein n=1 Tax=Rhizobium sp. NRK18 TaxID=2964667 RepID=UPI0021C3B222|nr:type II toxin-antitoxin system PrlF family antitoxin [Rhizobium sp. NRK18]MCQ2002833.1 type II toxin-antitoxin system PrlF family antitoxin [Rhizobium sp. NRK18]